MLGFTYLAQPPRPPKGRHGRKLLVDRSTPAEQPQSRRLASETDPSVIWALSLRLPGATLDGLGTQGCGPLVASSRSAARIAQIAVAYCCSVQPHCSVSLRYGDSFAANANSVSARRSGSMEACGPCLGGERQVDGRRLPSARSPDWQGLLAQRLRGRRSRQGGRQAHASLTGRQARRRRPRLRPVARGSPVLSG